MRIAARIAAPGATLTAFSVPGIRCAACIGKIERAVAAVPGVEQVRVNVTTRRVSARHREGLDPERLRAAIAGAGFDANPIAAIGLATGDESRALLRAVAVAGFAAMNVMLLSVSVWSGAVGETRDLFHWVSALIVLPAIAYSGRPFFRSAWRALSHRHTNMDVPISIGVVLACALSLYETATGGPHAYFDGAIMLVFFLLVGRYLDSMMRDRARRGVEALLRETAPGGAVIGADGTSRWVAAADLAPGMVLLVAAGERIAADGVVVAGASALDRSLITGESAPEAVRSGSDVLAGTINLDAPIRVRVTAAGEETRIAEIVRLMSAAEQGRSRYVRIADRASRLYAPAVHGLALAALIGWLIAGATVHQAVMIGVAVLIITCPCALGLAVPAAQVVVIGALMRRGILVKDGSALERLAEVDCARIDKTGTLTLGRPTLTRRVALPQAEAGVALALAQASRHPLAKALAAALVAQGHAAAPLIDVQEEPGNGVTGTTLDRRIARLGRPGWTGGIVAAGGAIATAFRIEDGPARLFAFDDPIRPDAAPALASLIGLAIPPMILSGDRREPVERLADTLGVPARFALTPADKLAEIERLAAQGRHVLVIGDGLNDGPALAAGHVSIAPGSASDVGQSAADIVFLSDSLAPVPIALRAARRTMRIVRENFGLAIAYNVVAVPLAMAGCVTPLIAALAMSGSSVLVVANALRLTRAAR